MTPYFETEESTETKEPEIVETQLELDTYRKELEILARERMPIFFGNSGALHGSIVLSTIFKNCSDKIRMYVKDLSGEVESLAPDFIENLTHFVEEKGTLKIVADVDIKNGTELKQKLDSLKTSGYDVQVKLASDEFKDIQDKLFRNFKYFTIGDDSMFRLELDSKKHTAICNFNQPEDAKNIINTFEKYFPNCVPLF